MIPNGYTIDDNLYYRAVREALKSPLFAMLTEKKYRDPPGYKHHRDVMLQISATMEMCVRHSELFLNRRGVKSFFLCTSEWLQKEHPAYWLNENLFDAFLNSNIEEPVTDLEVVIPHAILMLPRKLKSPDGATVSWVLITHRKLGEIMAVKRFGDDGIEELNPSAEFILWQSVLDDSSVYQGCINPQDMTDFDVIDSAQDLEDFDPAKEEIFARQLSNVVLQTLLVAQLKPELLGIETAPSSRGFGVSKAREVKPKAERLFNPVWIGSGFVNKVVTTKRHSSGSHSTKGTHWRRGHWRRIPVGPRAEGQRKLAWIKPTLVNP